MSEDATLEEFVENKKNNSSNLELGPIEIDIPNEWESRILSEVFDLVTGNNYSGEHLSDNDNSGRIFLTLKSVNKGGGFNWDSIKYYTGEVNERETVEPGELLISNTDVTQDGDIVGYSIRVPDFDSDREIAASMDLSILRPKSDNIAIPYVEYLIQTDYIHSRMRAFSAGSTVLHLNTDLVESLSLPFPPLPEQRKIATVLYTVDRAIEKNEEIRDQAKQSKKAVAQDLIHTGIGDQDTQSAWMGEIPIHWDVRDFSEIIELSRNGIYKDQDSYGGPYPIIKMGDIFGGVVLEEPIAESVHLDDDELEKYEAIEGDLVFARHAQAGWGAGDCTYVPDVDGKAVVESNMVQVRLNDEMEPLFYAQYFNSEIGVKSIKRITTTGNIKSISQDDLMKLKVPVPPKQEQKEIAKTLSSFDDLVNHSESEAQRLRRLKRGLMQDLLSGTVRTTDTNIEVPDKIAQHG